MGFDEFGHSVALSGDTVVVGAHYDTIGANALQGSAYVFIRNGLAWALQKKLVANNGGAEDLFGSSVAINGDTVVVGAPSHESGGNLRQGAVYVFHAQGRPGLRGEAHCQRWRGGRPLRQRGRYERRHPGGQRGRRQYRQNTDQGSAYVFTRIGNFFEQQKLTASDGAGAISSAMLSRSAAPPL